MLLAVLGVGSGDHNFEPVAVGLDVPGDEGWQARCGEEEQDGEPREVAARRRKPVGGNPEALNLGGGEDARARGWRGGRSDAEGRRGRHCVGLEQELVEAIDRAEAVPAGSGTVGMEADQTGDRRLAKFGGQKLTGLHLGEGAAEMGNLVFAVAFTAAARVEREGIGTLVERGVGEEAEIECGIADAAGVDGRRGEDRGDHGSAGIRIGDCSLPAHDVRFADGVAFGGRVAAGSDRTLDAAGLVPGFIGMHVGGVAEDDRPLRVAAAVGGRAARPEAVGEGRRPGADHETEAGAAGVGDRGAFGSGGIVAVGGDQLGDVGRRQDDAAGFTVEIGCMVGHLRRLRGGFLPRH